MNRKEALQKLIDRNKNLTNNISKIKFPFVVISGKDKTTLKLRKSILSTRLQIKSKRMLKAFGDIDVLFKLSLLNIQETPIFFKSSVKNTKMV